MFFPIKSLNLKHVYFSDNKKLQLPGRHKGNELITEHFSRHMARSIRILKIHGALKGRAKLGKRADENNSKAAEGDAINNSIPISGIYPQAIKFYRISRLGPGNIFSPNENIWERSLLGKTLCGRNHGSGAGNGFIMRAWSVDIGIDSDDLVNYNLPARRYSMAIPFVLSTTSFKDSGRDRLSRLLYSSLC